MPAVAGEPVYSSAREPSKKLGDSFSPFEEAWKATEVIQKWKMHADLAVHSRTGSNGC